MHRGGEIAHRGDDQPGERTEHRAEQEDARLACAHKRAHGARYLEAWQAPTCGGLVRTEHRRASEVAFLDVYGAPRKRNLPFSQGDLLVAKAVVRFGEVPTCAINAPTLRLKNLKETPMPTNRVYRVAVIPGDGIGKEVVP